MNENLEYMNNGQSEDESSNSKLYSLEKLLADNTPLPQPVVEGFIPGEAVVLLSGPGGHGKSYAMLDLAVCVAQGGLWLDKRVTQTPVLIIDLENRPIYQRERVRKILRGHSLKTPPEVMIAFDLGLRLDNDAVVTEIAYLAKQCGAGLVILDSLVDLLGDTDENSNTEMACVANRLRKLVQSTNASLIAIHHTPKSNHGTPRGASALRNGVDVSILVERKANMLTMQHDKNRLGPEYQILARMNWASSDLFSLLPAGTSPSSDKKCRDVDKGAILELLGDGRRHTSKSVVDHVIKQTKHSVTTVHRKLRALVTEGIIEKESGSPGKPYYLWLVDTGHEDGR